MSRPTALQRWQRAGEIALLVMGKTERRKGHEPRWRADEDPLAWWCATEMIFHMGEPHRAGLHRQTTQG